MCQSVQLPGILKCLSSNHWLHLVSCQWVLYSVPTDNLCQLVSAAMCFNLLTVNRLQHVTKCMCFILYAQSGQNVASWILVQANLHGVRQSKHALMWAVTFELSLLQVIKVMVWCVGVIPQVLPLPGSPSCTICCHYLTSDIHLSGHVWSEALAS